MEESIILFTQMKSKNQTQKKVVYIMAVLLGAVVGAFFWKSELEKAISVLLSHPRQAGRAVA